MSKYKWEDLILDPGQEFSTPEVLAADGDLSVAQKVKLLQAWERNTRQLMVAEGEGLGAARGGERDESALLQEILAALTELGQPHDPDHAQTDVAGSSS